MFINFETQELILLIAVIVNTLIAFAYFIWGLATQKSNRTKYVLVSVVLLLCPVVGIVCLGLCALLVKAFGGVDFDFLAISFDKRRVAVMATPDEAAEMNTVPIEEAMAITDKTGLRSLVLNVLKSDMDTALAAVSIAINSTDSETSHYSASVIMGALSEFRSSVQNMTTQLKKTPEDYELGLMLFEYLNDILSQDILTEFEQQSNVNIMEWTADVVYKCRADHLTPIQYQQLSERLMSAGDLQKASVWCNRARRCYPDAIESYYIGLKVEYLLGNKQAFFELLSYLKSSDIAVDQKTLDVMHTFC